MIYIPGAQYRREEEVRTAAVYARYEEGREFNHFSSTASERVRDEAISRNFAETLLAEFGKKNVKRHDQSDPIRGQIRQSQSRVYVPAVIRNTKVPTKVLIETANINNPTDRERLSDPSWRQAVAEAYVDALRRNFGATVGTKQARSGG
jgi:N-acetylmuramoyl-L-alanine amidase